MLPAGAVMMPRNGDAWVKSRVVADQLLADLTLLLTAPCRHIDERRVRVDQMSDDDRLQDVQEWTSTLTHHGILTADTCVIFMRRCDDGQLQLAFGTQQMRDTVKARIDACNAGPPPQMDNLPALEKP